MKLGDKVRILKKDYIGHEVGYTGTIVNHYWSDANETCFGVHVNEADLPLADVDEGWAYYDHELEIIHE